MYLYKFIHRNGRIYIIMINRILFNRILSSLQPRKAVVLVGARCVGKTFLIKKIMNEITEPYLFLNGEEISTLDLLERKTVGNYENLLESYQ